MMIKDFINEKTIFFVNEKKRNKVIDFLIEKAEELKKIDNKKNFKKAIEERENLMSTSIGLGIAIPHAKIESQKEFFIIAGILKNDVEWDSIDQKPVRLVFLIGGPSNDQKQYLKLLSQLILSVKDPDKREKILASENTSEIAKLFE